MEHSTAAWFKRTAIQNTLRQSTLFRDLKLAEMEALTDICQLKALEKGQFLFHEGETAHGFYIVQTGSLQVHRVTPAGKEQTIKIFRQFESLAEIVLSDETTFPVSALALENTQVVLVSRSGFLQLMASHPRMSLSMILSMCHHLRFLVQKIEDEKHKSIEARLALWITSQPMEASVDGSQTVHLPMHKRHLAAHLGVADATLSRAFAKLSNAGMIRVEEQDLIILDAKKLTSGWDS
jgi:CRP/FNR family transcriptional regulator, dissimilatory nitrate respiration regulator